MKTLIAKDMTEDRWKEWSEARKKLYRSVLLDPGASEEKKASARKKLESTRDRK